MQRTKSSIFESLGRRVRGSVFVDLYCGAGAMGIEALSRGALLVHFVEKDRAALDYLRRNLEECGVARERYRVHAGDVFEILRTGTLAKGRADIVLVDPPYNDTDFPVLLALLGGIGYSGSGLVVLEHPSGMTIKGAMPVLRAKTFGQTTVSYLQAGRSAKQ